MKILIPLLFVSLIVGVYSIIFYDPFSNCPLPFRFESETRCWLRDERNGTKLVELFNASQDSLWLAKVTSSKVTWLEHPHKHVQEYKPHVPDNVIKFEDDSLNSLLVNDIRFEVKQLESRPAPGSN